MIRFVSIAQRRTRNIRYLRVHMDQKINLIYM